MSNQFAVNDIHKNHSKLTPDEQAIVANIQKQTSIFTKLVSGGNSVVDFAAKVNSLNKYELNEMFAILSDKEVAVIYQKILEGKSPLISFILTGQGNIDSPIIQKYIAWKNSQ